MATERICSTCANGVKMCETRPCWGTPEEIDRLMDLGETDFMVDWWETEEITPDGEYVSNKIFIISPAIEGYSGQDAPWSPIGECVFLVDGLCYIHAVHGFDKKPYEGRIACCEHPSSIETHRLTAESWVTAKGLEVITRFENMWNTGVW